MPDMALEKYMHIKPYAIVCTGIVHSTSCIMFSYWGNILCNLLKAVHDVAMEDSVMVQMIDWLIDLFISSQFILKGYNHQGYRYFQCIHDNIYIITVTICNHVSNNNVYIGTNGTEQPDYLAKRE
jgi:hypothetical protein